MATLRQMQRRRPAAKAITTQDQNAHTNLSLFSDTSKAPRLRGAPMVAKLAASPHSSRVPARRAPVFQFVRYCDTPRRQVRNISGRCPRASNRKRASVLEPTCGSRMREKRGARESRHV
jgi:hypothetical protein